MSPIVHFETMLDSKGYRLSATHEDQLELVPNGGTLLRREPFNLPGGQLLFQRFAAITDAEDLRSFADRYGDFGHTYVAYCLSYASWFNEVLRWKQNGSRTSLYPQLDDSVNDPLSADVETKLVRGKGIQIRVVPVTLLDALRLQLAQALNGNGEITTCRECGNLFMTGSRGGPRRGAKFCSPGHQRRYNNFGRKNASRP
jgi:hypothetical protein